MTQIVNLTKIRDDGSTTVYIEANKVDEILVNPLIKISMPIPAVSSKTPETRLLDLKRIAHVFNIDGFLSVSAESGNNGATWSGGTMSTAKDVKDALIKDILYLSGNIELRYRNVVDRDYSLKYYDNKDTSTTHVKTLLDKISVQESILRAEDRNSGVVRRYSIKINLTRGKVR